MVAKPWLFFVRARELALAAELFDGETTLPEDEGQYAQTKDQHEPHVPLVGPRHSRCQLAFEETIA